MYCCRFFGLNLEKVYSSFNFKRQITVMMHGIGQGQKSRSKHEDSSLIIFP